MHVCDNACNIITDLRTDEAETRVACLWVALASNPVKHSWIIHNMHVQLFKKILPPPPPPPLLEELHPLSAGHTHENDRNDRCNSW